MRLSYEQDDPLSAVLRPPPNETPEERDIRLKKEADAKRVSDQIDEGIKAERAALKKRRDTTKLLLLGQSESGKSTTLKNLQLTFAPNAWLADRASWRAVIQLNLVRAINTILDVVATEMASAVRPCSRAATLTSPSPPPTTSSVLGDIDEDDDVVTSDSHGISDASRSPLLFTNHHSVLKLSLAPLRSVEDDLKQFLGAGSDEINAESARFSSEHALSLVATPFDDTAYGSGLPSSRRPQEFTVRSTSSWKSALGSRSRPASPRKQASDLDAVTDVISGCRDDMQTLWQDSLVRELLRRKRIQLPDSAVYYLDNVDRIAQSNYDPSNNDVLRARLRTLGVQEHHLVFENPSDFNFGNEWIIYDVGGSRSSRSAWLPYFDDTNAILFLAPISCFDEQLAEDPGINRLQDSYILWKSIVSSKLLAKCAIILFMNKYDLLSRKLKSGTAVKEYMPTYGDRENTAQAFSKYLRHQFKSQLAQFSPQPRPFYGFMTSVIDHKATAATLAYVRDSILRDHLKQADFV